MATEVYSTLFTEVTGEQYGELRQKDGIELGEMIKIMSQVRTKLRKDQKDQSVEIIADALEDSTDTLLPIVKAIKENPKATDEEICTHILQL